MPLEYFDRADGAPLREIAQDKDVAILMVCREGIATRNRVDVALEEPKADLGRAALRKTIGAENENLFVAHSAGYAVESGIRVGDLRSEERRVGKEWRSRWSQEQSEEESR